MTSIQRNAVPLRDALYELSMTERLPDAETLDAIIARHPEHAAALTEFAIALALDAFAEENTESAAPPSADISPTVSRAMSRYQNRLYELKKARAAPADAAHEVTENPFLPLNRAQMRSLVERLNINTVFAIKLRDRQITSDTIPDALARRVAEELNVPLHVVADHFAAQSEIQQAAHFNANQKPQVGAKQTFEEAVRGSGLSPEQQEYLLTL